MLTRKLIHRRLISLKSYRGSLFALGRWLHELANAGDLITTLGNPISTNWYGIRVSDQALSLLRRSTDDFCNYDLYRSVVELENELFFQRYQITPVVAVERLECFCDKNLGSGEFMFSRVQHSEYLRGDFEISIVHLPPDLEDKLFYIIFRYSMNDTDRLYLRKSGRVLPPFRYRALPLIRDFDMDAIRSPCPQAKDYRVLSNNS
jgi:hypothetical protein